MLVAFGDQKRALRKVSNEITCQRKKLEDYALGYSAFFRVGRKNNVHCCWQYLQGLFHQCKSNIERISEGIAQSNYQQLHHFISHCEWSAQDVNARSGAKNWF